MTDYKKIREEMHERFSKTFEKLHMSEKNDEIAALRAENERLRTNAVKMLDEVDREYNRKTNAMIERHAATVARLTAENTRLRSALFAWMDAVVIDVTMEGPRYMGVSSTLGRKAWKNTLDVFNEMPRT
jgi:hypothetical protein